MDIQTYVGKYVGPNKIGAIEASKEKTYLGNQKLNLIYESGQTMSLPTDVLAEIATEASVDLTELREKRVKPVVEKIIAILTEVELTNEDMNYAIGPKLTESLNHSFSESQKILWGKENFEVTLLDIDKILKSSRLRGIGGVQGVN